MNISKSK